MLNRETNLTSEQLIISPTCTDICEHQNTHSQNLPYDFFHSQKVGKKNKAELSIFPFLLKKLKELGKWKYGNKKHFSQRHNSEFFINSQKQNKKN